MHVRAKLLAAFACAAAVVAVVAPTAATAKTECNGFYANTTFSGGVVVNSGDTCSLDYVTITGGLTVNGDGGLAALSVQNSNISGGWTMTGDVIPFNNNNIFNDDFCGNNVTGSLIVNNLETLSPVVVRGGERRLRRWDDQRRREVHEQRLGRRRDRWLHGHRRSHHHREHGLQRSRGRDRQRRRHLPGGNRQRRRRRPEHLQRRQPRLPHIRRASRYGCMDRWGGFPPSPACC